MSVLQTFLNDQNRSAYTKHPLGFSKVLNVFILLTPKMKTFLFVFNHNTLQSS